MPNPNSDDIPVSTLTKEKLVVPENRPNKQGVEVVPTHLETERHPEFEGYI